MPVACYVVAVWPSPAWWTPTVGGKRWRKRAAMGLGKRFIAVATIGRVDECLTLTSVGCAAHDMADAQGKVLGKAGLAIADRPRNAP